MMNGMSELVLIRHGETEWSKSGRHTGRTDVPLTARGEEQARALVPLLDQRHFGEILISPAERARRTAELANLTGTTTPELWEWDYGGYEGKTTAEVREDRPNWSVWSDPIIPGDADHPGEDLTHVGARADRVIERIHPVLEQGRDVALVAHGHTLRILTARWLGLSAQCGALFALEPATLSTLGFEHDGHVIWRWNVSP